MAVPADLTSEEGANALIAETVKRYGRIDILVNLAGRPDEVWASGRVDAWRIGNSELNNNLRSAFLCSRAVWPVMKQQGGGKILNFSTAGGVHGASPE